MSFRSPPAPDDDIDALPPATEAPVLADGAELVGEFSGSGYREPPQLICLATGQLVRLPPLLYSLARIMADETYEDREFADRAQALDYLADAVSQENDARLTADQVVFLLDQKLAPLGVTSYSDGRPPADAKATPLLALRFKMALLPETATWLLSGLFSWLYRPVVLVAAIIAILACEIWLFTTQQIAEALRQTLLNPASILLIVLLAIVSCAVHEVGHASACRYSGARPGAMGCGIYLVWPVFYTDITNSYRLGRRGRIRTDLGGIYFNGLFVIVMTLAYLQTGFQPLLVVVLSANIEIAQQLLPMLRFDGYYIVADLVGIPDLFKYIGPILKRTLLRKPPDEQLRALKRRPQLVVTVWVVGVLPALLVQLGIIVVQLPRLVETAWQSLLNLTMSAGSPGATTLGVVSAVVQMLLLLLPIAGITLLVVRLVGLLVKLVRRRFA